MQIIGRGGILIYILQKNALLMILAIVFIIKPTPKTIKAPIKMFLNQVLALLILVGSAPALIYMMPETITAIKASRAPMVVKNEPTLAIKTLSSAKVRPWPGTGGVGIIIWAISIISNI